VTITLIPKSIEDHWNISPVMVELTADVLYHLSAYLDDRDLRNFSLVNRLFNDVSRRYLYRTIVIELCSPDTLDVAVAIWTRILERANSFKYVRHVQVLAKHLDDHRNEFEEDYHDCGDDPLATWKYWFVSKSDELTMRTVFMDKTQVLITRDSQWEDLSRFMQNFPNLKELTWGCEEQIPASVFRYISQKYLRLRLHMPAFKLPRRIGVNGEPGILDLDPYHVELATSPCLYSLTLFTVEDTLRSTEHAIMDMLAGAAPNLRELNMIFDTRDMPESEPKYRCGSQIAISPSGLGMLRHLGIFMVDHLSTLHAYSTVTDSTMLKSLEIHGNIRIEPLLWLTSIQLPALEHLSFHVVDRRLVNIHDSTEAAKIVGEAITCLVASLSSLQSLKMGGPYGEDTLSTVLEYCGHRLRRLLLTTYRPDFGRAADEFVPIALVGVDLVQEVQRKCPQLEELALVVPRSKGDANEVALYRALGSLASVRKLHLSMYCSEL
jgi:hypothetical protein